MLTGILLILLSVAAICLSEAATWLVQFRPVRERAALQWGLVGCGVIGLVMGVFLAFAGRALAAEAGPTSVDIRPLWGYGVELLVAVLGVLGTWAISRLSAWLGLRQGDSMRTYVDDAFIRALQYGAEALLAQGKDLGKVDVRSELVATAAKYAVETVPDALRHFGIDAAGLEKRLLARLPEVIPHPAQPVAYGTLLDAP